MVGVSPVPITGYGACNALGGDRESLCQGLATGCSGLGPVPFDVPFETVVGAVKVELPELPSELRPWSNRMARMAASLLQQIDGELNVARSKWSPDRIGVLLGTSTGGADVTEVAYGHYLEHGALPDDYDFRRQHNYSALLHVVSALSGARGPAWMTSTTCTSSAKPLASAMRLIAADVIDAAIVGGLDTLCSMTLHGFHALGALSPSPCTPFAERRLGINIGEGGAFLLVERRGEGRALLEGVGESCDAYHISAPHPEGLGAKMAMQRALEQVGCRPEDVDHINAHGTGTPLNDMAESKAIAGLFGTDIPVVSTKGYTGHALGGAGATEAVFSVMAIEEGWIPVSLGADPRDPEIGIHVVTERLKQPLRRVLSNSFAFGGNNVSVVVRGV